MGKQSKKKKTRRDTAEIALLIVEKVTGEKLSGEPEPVEPEEEVEDTRNPVAVALSKLGASKRGKARAGKLTAKKRIEIARKAAKARWAKK